MLIHTLTDDEFINGMDYVRLTGYLKLAEAEYTMFCLYKNMLQDVLDHLDNGGSRDDFVRFDDSVPISSLFVNVNLVLCHVKDDTLRAHVVDSIALLNDNIFIWESLRDSGEIDMMRAMSRQVQTGVEHENPSDQ